jgi:hypothetical protein
MIEHSVMRDARTQAMGMGMRPKHQVLAEAQARALRTLGMDRESVERAARWMRPTPPPHPRPRSVAVGSHPARVAPEKRDE